MNHLTPNLKWKSQAVRSTDWACYLSLVALLLHFGRAGARLLQQGGELPQLLVAVRQGGQGLLLELLCLGHPVHALQPDGQESAARHVARSAKIMFTHSGEKKNVHKYFISIGTSFVVHCVLIYDLGFLGFFFLTADTQSPAWCSAPRPPAA